jgi:hypothetical protein
LFGVFCGFIPISGLSGILLFAVINVLIPFCYYAKYANVNIDDFGSTALIGEGFQQSTGVFLLSWIITYSAVYF